MFLRCSLPCLAMLCGQVLCQPRAAVASEPKLVDDALVVAEMIKEFFPVIKDLSDGETEKRLRARAAGDPTKFKGLDWSFEAAAQEKTTKAILRYEIQIALRDSVEDAGTWLENFVLITVPPPTANCIPIGPRPFIKYCSESTGRPGDYWVFYQVVNALVKIVAKGGTVVEGGSSRRVSGDDPTAKRYLVTLAWAVGARLAGNRIPRRPDGK